MPKKKSTATPATNRGDINWIPAKKATPKDEAAAQVDQAINKAAKEQAQMENDFTSTVVTLNREVVERGLLPDSGTTFAHLLKLVQELRLEVLRSFLEVTRDKVDNDFSIPDDVSSITVNRKLNNVLLEKAFALSLDAIETEVKRAKREREDRRKALG